MDAALAAHEAKCQRCGVGCHAAARVGDRQYVVEGLHCIHLRIGADGKTACAVYPRRHELAPWCRDMDTALSENIVRDDCPYRAGADGKGKIRLSPQQYAQRWEEIADQILTGGPWPHHFSWKKFLRCAEAMDPRYAWSLRTNLDGSKVQPERKPRLWARLLGRV